jgi:hypothetical protein
MKRRQTIIFFTVLVVSAALAQQKKTVRLAPKPADERPSLEETMKFIQDKLNDVGPVNLVQYIHDNAAGTDSTHVQLKIELTNVVADSGACRISYHHKLEAYGSLNPGSDSWFQLNAVVDAAVIPLEQHYKELHTASGHPTYDTKVDPPVFVLTVRGPDKKRSDFFFFDEQMANRVAKAMAQAVKLCGGGSKPERF